MLIYFVGLLYFDALKLKLEYITEEPNIDSNVPLVFYSNVIFAALL